LSEWEVRVLTREEIMNMKPGRELDVPVAEKVMGWRKKTFPGGGGGFTAWVDENEKVMKLISNSTMSETCYRCDYFRPSTDIAAAWEVWEHNRPRNWRFTLTWTNGKYLALIIAETEKGHKTLAQVEAYSAAEAMVKCRLLAVMEGEKDD